MRGREEGALLETAIGYALCSLRPVGPELLCRPTPCDGWDLMMLLRHANDSLAALAEGLGAGRVGPGAAAEPCRDPAETFRARAVGLRSVWRASGARGTPGAGGDRPPVAVGGLPLAPAVVALTGALEIAVHGWDIAQATGLPRPIPAALAVELMRTAGRLVPPEEQRHPLFARPVRVSPLADPSDRLVAFLGREPPRGGAGVLGATE